MVSAEENIRQMGHIHIKQHGIEYKKYRGKNILLRVLLATCKLSGHKIPKYQNPDKISNFVLFGLLIKHQYRIFIVLRYLTAFRM